MTRAKIILDSNHRTFFFRGKRVLTLLNHESIRQCSRFKFILVGKDPMLYDLKRGVNQAITRESKIGGRYARR